MTQVPTSSRSSSFAGGTITDGLTATNSGIDIEAVSGEALHIGVGSSHSIRVVSGATVLFNVDKFGFVEAIEGLAVGPDDYLYILNTTVPADGSLGNGTLAFWLDATPGATKLMVKAKDSGGTVRTGAIALA